jgi:hypothetical protein
MFKVRADGECVEEVPVPASMRETGTIPDGYTIGWFFSSTLAVLAKALFQILCLTHLQWSLR